MSNRVRYYPYRVVYLDLNDFMNTPNGQNLPVVTDIVRARTADEAKAIVRGKTSATVAIASSGRYPERLGTSIVGTEQRSITSLSRKQLNALDEEVRSGAATVPHAINPKNFVTKNPNSTIHTRPVQTPWPSQNTKWPSQQPVVTHNGVGNTTYRRPNPSTAPVGAVRTVAKSTPIALSTTSLDIAGFSVGFRKPGDAAVAPTPTVARPTPQPDIYGDINSLRAATVAGGSLVNSTVQAVPSPVAMPSGFYQFTTKDGTTHDAVKTTYTPPEGGCSAAAVATARTADATPIQGVIQDGDTFAIAPPRSVAPPPAFVIPDLHLTGPITTNADPIAALMPKTALDNLPADSDVIFNGDVLPPPPQAIQVLTTAPRMDDPYTDIKDSHPVDQTIVLHSDPDKLDAQIADFLRVKADKVRTVMPDTPQVVFPDLKSGSNGLGFFAYDPTIPPPTCSCCETPKSNVRKYVTLAVVAGAVVAGIIYSLVK